MKVWEDYMLHRKSPKIQDNATPIEKNLLLGQKSLKSMEHPPYFEKWYWIAGMPQNAEQIEQLLKAAEQSK